MEMCSVFLPILLCYYLFVWRNLMISFCEINRQNFPQLIDIIFVMCLALTSVRSSAGGGGEGNSRKIGLGVDCVLGYQTFSNQSRHTYWDKQKKVKKIRILISRPNSTPKQKSKNYDIYDRIQTQNGWEHLPFALCKRIWLKINV